MSDSTENDITNTMIKTFENKLSTEPAFTPVTLEGVTQEDLDKFTIEELKRTLERRQKRISGRNPDEHYTAPMGLFNLGNNSLYIGENEIKKEDDNDDLLDESDIKVVNKIKIDADGKMFMTEEEQEDLEKQQEQNRALQISVKNDIPFQIYRKIEHFGRLTVEELHDMYKALGKEIFLIIVNDMLAKRYLKKVKDIDKLVKFDSGEEFVIMGDGTLLERFNQSIKYTEVEVETLEIVSDEERKRILEV